MVLHSIKLMECQMLVAVCDRPISQVNLLHILPLKVLFDVLHTPKIKLNEQNRYIILKKSTLLNIKKKLEIVENSHSPSASISFYPSFYKQFIEKLHSSC